MEVHDKNHDARVDHTTPAGVHHMCCEAELHTSRGVVVLHTNHWVVDGILHVHGMRRGVCMVCVARDNHREEEGRDRSLPHGGAVLVVDLCNLPHFRNT